MKKFCFALCITQVLCINQALSSEAGMPQLNSEFWPSQIFWLIITFSFFYLIIWKIFLPRISQSIENRKSKLVSDINKAQKLKEEAEIKLKEYNKIIENAKKEAKKIIENNKRKLDLDIESKKLKFNSEMEKEIKAIEKEILSLKKTSVININKIAAEISSEVIKKLLNSEVNKSNVVAIVEDVSKKRIERIYDN